MKFGFRVLALAAALLAVSCAHAASFRVTFNMPSFDNVGTCSSPILTPQSAGHRNRARLSWSGPSAGADSVSNLLDGDSAIFVRNGIPEGLYTFRASVCDSGGCSCDTTVTRFLGSPPATPTNVK